MDPNPTSPQPNEEPAPQPTPTPVTQPIDMATVQNPAAATAPAPQQKKSHTGLIIAIVLIVLFGLPILGFILFTVIFFFIASTLGESDIQ